jgi:lysophospholipase L1-like esterase
MALTKLYDGSFLAVDNPPGTINDVAATGPTGAWADRSGVNYHNINVGGAGLLTSRNPDGGGNQFARWTGGAAQLDSVLIVDYTNTPLPGGQGQIWGFGLRVQDGSDKGLVGWGYPGHFELRRFNFNYPTEGKTPLSNPLPESAEAFVDPGTGLRGIIWIYGTNPTTFRVQLRNPVTNTVVFDQTATETDPAFQNPGRPILWAGPFGNSGMDRQTISRVQYYSGTGDPFVVGGILTLTGATRAGISLALSDPEAPVSYQVSDDNFATAPATIPGASGLTLDYPIADDVVRYFRGAWGATPSYSNVIAGCRTEEDVRMVPLANSIVEQGEAATPADSILTNMQAKLLAIHPRRQVQYVNTAHGGSDTGDWLPPGTIYNGSPVDGAYFTQLLDAANTIDANWCLVHIGANEANITVLDEARDRLQVTLAALRTARPTMKIIIEGNTPMTPEPPTAAGFFPAWSVALDGLCDGVNIVRGDKTTYRTISLDPDTYLADSVHLTPAGRKLVGETWATDLLSTLYPKAIGGTSTDPGIANVRAGIPYAINSAPLTGTLVLPGTTHVETGYPYGAGGTEFTGSLDAGSGGSTDLTEVLDALAAVRADTAALVLAQTQLQNLVITGTVAASPPPTVNGFTVTLDYPFTKSENLLVDSRVNVDSLGPVPQIVADAIKNNDTSIVLILSTPFIAVPAANDRVTITG